ncbi:glycoside hydrolase family protein [Pseudorhodoferax sp. Leaf265]|uniref:glycoside hydrolase family protein n=1 Tax=Pseudorhodoferax sp. Leaf265 TaxID=1736315 RepID=UPI0006F76702|nr:glycoside hydrolase family protein [Pseudorhodoferax sp. Leaf265]KQP02443.1 endolysin [Pseudorhodoferax sp. Leaf265]
MSPVLRKRLLAVAASVAVAGGAFIAGQRPSAEVLLAMELGAHFESSGRHIGTPYVDRLGKGQPLTVCNGITGPEVVAGRTYSPEDCHRIELPRYREAEKQAKARLRHWDTYNPWVRASFIDMVFNLGPGSLDGTTIQRLANSGDLAGACAQMPRWVYGTVAGQRTKLPGLVDRRNTTNELCAEWGRSGHFSAGLLAGGAP